MPDYTQYNEDSFDTWKEQVNGLLSEYLDKLEAVKIRGALATVLSISQQGNFFLQSNGLDTKLAANEPLKCAALVGLTLNLIHLLASIVSPFMPDTANSMNTQLRAEALPIPDYWYADSVKPGHEIGKATFLFSNIKPEKAVEWRRLFGVGGGGGLPAQPQHLDITGIHVDTQPCFYYRVAGQRYQGIQ